MVSRILASRPVFGPLVLVGVFWLMAVSIGCAESKTSVCANGVRCPLDKVCAEAENQCVDLFGCGNGELDPGEVCDDGNITTGDGCSADCLSTEICGNGVVELQEACDERPADGVFCLDLGYDFGHMSCTSNCESDDKRCGGLEWSRVDSTIDRTIRALWGIDTYIYAVGDDTTILLYDGERWSNVSPPVDLTDPDVYAADLRAIWGSGLSDIHAVGDGGVIWHFDGSNWSPTIHTATVESLHGIWGDSAANVFVVGERGTIMRYDGSSWSSEPSIGIAVDLYSIWGTPDGATYFAVGAEGTIIRRTAGSWSLEETSVTDALHGVWGTSISDILAVGVEGTITRFDGSAWQSLTPPTPHDLTAVWGDENEVFVIGDAGVILRESTDGFDIMKSTVQDRLEGIGGTSAERVFVAGAAGRMLRHGPQPWFDTGAPDDQPLFDLWGNRFDDVFAVGANGTLLHYDGSVWRRQGTSLTDEWLYSVWSAESNNVFAVGTNGAVVHYDGTAWTVMDAKIPNATLRDVWGDGGDVYAVGDDSVLIRYDGERWSPLSLSVGQGDFFRVWRHESVVYIVGEQGLFRWQDGALIWEGLHAARAPRDIWGDRDSGLFVVGDQGLFTKFEPGVLTLLDVPTTHNLVSIWGTNRSDIYLVGERDTLIHYNSISYSPIATPPDVRDFKAVWVADDASVFLLSGDSAIHRLRIPADILQPE